MKSVHFLLSIAALLALCGCGSSPQVAVAPTAIPTAISTSIPTSAPLAVIRTNRSSLPSLPQMMDNSPRPTYVPVPTPKVRPGQTIVISNARATPRPRENPTIIISNAPVEGKDISAPVAAERGLVWINTASRERVFHRPGGRFYGGTVNGYYITEAQAIARGYRAARR